MLGRLLKMDDSVTHKEIKLPADDAYSDVHHTNFHFGQILKDGQINACKTYPLTAIESPLSIKHIKLQIKFNVYQTDKLTGRISKMDAPMPVRQSIAALHNFETCEPSFCSIFVSGPSRSFIQKFLSCEYRKKSSL